MRSVAGETRVRPSLFSFPRDEPPCRSRGKPPSCRPGRTPRCSYTRRSRGHGASPGRILPPTNAPYRRCPPIKASCRPGRIRERRSNREPCRRAENARSPSGRRPHPAEGRRSDPSLPLLRGRVGRPQARGRSAERPARRRPARYRRRPRPGCRIAHGRHSSFFQLAAPEPSWAVSSDGPDPPARHRFLYGRGTKPL